MEQIAVTVDAAQIVQKMSEGSELLRVLKIIAGWKVTETTNHRELLALSMAMADIAIRKQCCGDAACWNESQGGECNAFQSKFI